MTVNQAGSFVYVEWEIFYQHRSCIYFGSGNAMNQCTTEQCQAPSLSKN